MMLIDTGGAAVAHREERATVMKTERDRGGNEAADWEEKKNADEDEDRDKGSSTAIEELMKKTIGMLVGPID